MFFEYLLLNPTLIWAGLNHTVEILQSYVFFSISFTSCLLLLLTWTQDLKRFFFFSELAWLFLFALALGLSQSINSTHLYSNAFFILIFTACEAVTLASLLLVSFEGRKKNATI